MSYKERKTLIFSFAAIMFAVVGILMPIASNNSFEVVVNNTNLAPTFPGEIIGTGERIADNTTYWANSTPIELFAFAHSNTAAQTSHISLYINGTQIEHTELRPLGAGERTHTYLHGIIPKGANYSVNASNYHHYEWREYSILSGQNGTLSINQTFVNITNISGSTVPGGNDTYTYLVFSNGTTKIKNGTDGTIVYDGGNDISSFMSSNLSSNQYWLFKNVDVVINSVTKSNINNLTFQGYGSSISTTTGLVFSISNNILINGFDISGSSSGNAGLMRFANSENLELSRNIIRPSSGRGVFMSNVNKTRILYNSLYNSTVFEQFVISGMDTVIEGNRFENTLNTMGLLTSGSLGNAKISKNIFYSTNLSYASLSLEDFADFPENGTAFNDINFYDNYVFGAPVITVWRSPNHLFNSIRIERNEFNNQFNHTYAPIQMDARLRNLKIINNNMTQEGFWDDIHINPPEILTTEVIGEISNNRLNRNLTVGNDFSGIQVYNGSYIIQNNVIKSYNGIYLSDISNSIVSGNRMNISGTGIILRSPSASFSGNNIISNNYIRATSSASNSIRAIKEFSSTSAKLNVITDNYFTNFQVPLSLYTSTNTSFKNIYRNNYGVKPFDFGDCSDITWLTPGGHGGQAQSPFGIGDSCTNTSDGKKLLWNGSNWNFLLDNTSTVQSDNSTIKINESQVNNLPTDLNSKVNISGDNMTGTLYTPEMIATRTYNLSNKLLSSPKGTGTDYLAQYITENNSAAQSFINYFPNNGSTGIFFSPIFSAFRMNGTQELTQPLDGGQLIFAIGARGSYKVNDSGGVNNASSNRGSMLFITSGIWNSTSQGVNYNIFTTTEGTTSTHLSLNVTNAGNIELPVTGKGITMHSPNGNAWCTSVTNLGALSTVAGACT